MKKHLYVLRDGQPVATDDALEWGNWFASSAAERSVAVTKLLDQGKVHTRVSTCFLGVDHDWTGAEHPILWETAIFYSAPERDVCIERRYASRLDAIAGHHRVVAEVVERIATSLGRQPEAIFEIDREAN